MSSARFMSAAVTAVVALAATRDAHAQSKGDDQPDFMRAPIVAARRHGFTAGVSLAPATVWARGTPTAYAQRNSAYEQRLGPAVAPSVSAHLGYALADEVSFTLAVEPSLYSHGDRKISGTSLAFRVELWPLVSLGGAFRDLGVVARAGLGSARVKDASGASLASSGNYSLVGLDLIWDAARFHGLALGPTLGLTHRSSETWTETDLQLGLRVAFYGGP
jgi:hypothetical protein